MKILIAIDNKKINDIFKNINNNNLVIRKVQYREAILEILKKEKNINYIFLHEKLPGIISIEDLIVKIREINKKINIIFFLEKKNIDKEKKLNNLFKKNILIVKKTNKKHILKKINLLEINFNSNDKIKNKKIKGKNNYDLYIFKKFKYINIIINKIKNNYNKYRIKNNNKKILNKNNIISVYGEPKSGKTTIIYLIIIFLLKINKKILVINFSKNENNYITKMINLKYNNNKTINKKIRIKKNLNMIFFFENFFENKKEFFEVFKKIIEENKEIYDYTILDIGYIHNKKLRNKIIALGDKKIFVFTKEILGIKELIKKFKNQNTNKKQNKNNLHIIQNKYNFNSISSLIIHNILYKFCFVYKIPYNKNLKYLKENFFKNKKIKIKYQTNRLIKKIFFDN